MNKQKKTLMVIGLLIAVLGSGCAGRKAIVKDTFLLDAQRGGQSLKAAPDTVLAVRQFSIAPAYQDKGLVYRTGDNQYESDFYNEYFVSPPAMMTDQTRNWLSESGVFAQVLSPVSSIEPTHILEGHIKQIAADVRDKANPQAVLEISFFLLEQQKHDRTIRFQKTYSATQPLESKTAAACIDALNQCLGQIMKAFEEDLASNL
jgi:cholesterol transport system auxiliary component